MNAFMGFECWSLKANGVVQSFRTGILGDIPKNCFRYETSRIYFSTNTSLTLALAFSSNVFTNSNRSTDPTYNIQIGSQAALALFTDNLNSIGSFEMAYQSINSSNNVQVSPSVRHNLKAFPNGNTTVGITDPFLFNALHQPEMAVTRRPFAYPQQLPAFASRAIVP